MNMLYGDNLNISKTLITKVLNERGYKKLDKLKKP